MHVLTCRSCRRRGTGAGAPLLAGKGGALGWGAGCRGWAALRVGCWCWPLEGGMPAWGGWGGTMVGLGIDCWLAIFTKTPARRWPCSEI